MSGLLEALANLLAREQVAKMGSGTLWSGILESIQAEIGLIMLEIDFQQEEGSK